MIHLRLIGQFVRASVEQEIAYPGNFLIGLLYSALNLITGVAGLAVIFGQTESVRGWTLPSMLALLGVYLLINALRALFIGPSLDALAGIDGEVWDGRFDFVLPRPVGAQFVASFRYWRLWALVDVVLPVGVLAMAMIRLGEELSATRLMAFLVAISLGIVIAYAILLTFTAAIFWSQGTVFTWIFNSVFQMGRYPVGLYPGWLRLMLTWVVPVGFMTTVPAQALAGEVAPGMLWGGAGVAMGLLVASSALFRVGLRRYASASS
jgi:ABC-2 type transport system permease protein